ncbi:hypothetical protein GCM10022251_30910 [Phytohabitans flavus]|uniref:LCCL domain-containing protein n=1 Tax=Phytohabitans flavus TaxID=1076124 RepID=A0A6F8XX60_9ACTN|nr:LCCL domain-containing protein [Phytohabitans flavus]BCB78321.1 hypothetical protein Pflav_047310 [Phytohabitans flavus]
MRKFPRIWKLIVTILVLTPTALVAASTPAHAIDIVTWGTNASAYRGMTGDVTVICPAAGSVYATTGTFTYTDSSSICSAAAHAGVITVATGGFVTITPNAGTAFYYGTTRNGVTTSSYGYSYPGFTIVDGTTDPGGIGWNRGASEFRGRGGTFTFICPAGGSYYATDGTFTYTDSSSICTAAAHAGVITAASGGQVTITPTTGTAFYYGTTRNGVTTNSYGYSYPGFTILGGTTDPGGIGWNRGASEFRGRGGTFTFICPAGGSSYATTGTFTYTDGSSICTAAAHAGVITIATGGPVTITPDAGTAFYYGTTRNGVTTNSYGYSAPGFTVAGGTTAPGAIGWNRGASEFRSRTGPFTFICPAGGSFYATTGTFTYSDDSSICTAAVHAGVITVAAGGPVTITPTAGTAFYIGTTRNGATTNSYGYSYPGYTFAGGTTAPGGIGWNRTAAELRGRAGSFTFICPAGGSFYAVTGTGTYADSSSICTAAVHAGVITRAAGGTVTVTPNSGTASYAGTTANGVTTSSYGYSYPGFTVS